MRMGLNTLSHLQYKIQQARYQLDALAYNMGICYSTLLKSFENICFSMDLIKVTLHGIGMVKQVQVVNQQL